MEVIKHRVQKGLTLDALWTDRPVSNFSSEKRPLLRSEEVQLKFDYLQKKVRIMNKRRRLLFWVSFEGLKAGKLSTDSLNFLSQFFAGKFSGAFVN